VNFKENAFIKVSIKSLKKLVVAARRSQKGLLGN
jgi:hypothetical protein